MTKKRFTPGVYIQKNFSPPPAVKQAETRIVAFVGYTEIAQDENGSLLNTPTRISSFAEYQSLFGSGYAPKFAIVPKISGDTETILINDEEKSLVLKANQTAYLYEAVRDFYLNGGSDCIIVSVGSYSGKNELLIKKDELLGSQITSLSQLSYGGLKALEQVDEPGLIVIPDAVSLGDECYEVYQKMLQQCANLRDRFAVFDIYDGYQKRSEGRDCVTHLRNSIGESNLTFGAVYYPWLLQNLDQIEVSAKNIDPEISLSDILPEPHVQTFLNSTPTPSGDYLHQGLLSFSSTYSELLKIIRGKLKLVPAAGAIAGIISKTDAQSGVWKAPANINLSGVQKPSVALTNQSQQDLNGDAVSGKSINAIRFFPGKGTLVWGARTLAGSDPEWRYIPVKRTYMMIEESVKNSLENFATETNDATTWNKVKSMCENYLQSLWRKGAMQGAKTEDAYFVKVGLGETMTAQDILDNQMIVSIGVSMVRPAAYIVVHIKQEMSGS